jgi:hypothetical protein
MVNSKSIKQGGKETWIRQIHLTKDAQSLDHQHATTAAPAIEMGIFSGMDCGVRWQGFDAQVAVDGLLRTPEQMPPKIPPLNRRRSRHCISEFSQRYAWAGRTKKRIYPA